MKKFVLIHLILCLILLNTSCKNKSSRKIHELIINSQFIEELNETVQSGSFTVLENPDDDEGRIITIHFVILPARTSNPEPDPILVFDGGPGCGAASRVVDWAGYFEKFRKKREILLVDQRGTGKSNPLFCRRIGDQQSAQTFLQDFLPEDYVTNCRQDLERIADLNYYHSTLAIDDIYNLCMELGYGKVNLFGASYGGYMAQVYMKYHPEHARTAFLDCPAIPALLYPATLAADTELSLRQLFDDCASDPECAKDYPDLESEFHEVLFRLQQGPVTVNITNPITKKPETVSFSLNHFIQGFRSMLYSANRQRWAPAMIYWAYRDVYFPLVETIVDQLYWVNQIIMDGMFLCVSCSESIPFIDYSEARNQAKGTFVGTYRLDQQYQGCQLWVQSVIPADFHDLLTEPIPTLIITGEFDVPVPPYAGKILDDSLPNSFHYTVPNCGHGLSEIWENCLDDIVIQFIETASPSGLDTSCADNNQRPPFISWRDYTKLENNKISVDISSR